VLLARTIHNIYTNWRIIKNFSFRFLVVQNATSCQLMIQLYRCYLSLSRPDPCPSIFSPLPLGPSFIHSSIPVKKFKRDGFSSQSLIASSIFNSRVSCLFFRFSYLSVIFPSSCEIPRAKTCCCNFMVYKKSQQVLRSELIDVLGMNSITTSTRREVIFGKSRNFTKNTVKLSLS
jgi:hypothetical protein